MKNKHIYPIINLKPSEIVDTSFLHTVLETIEPNYLQLRIKNGEDRDFLENAEIIQEVIDHIHPETKFIINDRYDIAARKGIWGVHIGQNDDDVIKIKQQYPNLAVGLSTHTIKQVKAANELPINYIGFGPVFSTQTKNTGYNPVYSLITEAVSCSRHPVILIGGIDRKFLDRLPFQNNIYYAMISSLKHFV